MNGVLNIYKPIGITSFDVIRQIKRITGLKKIGHTGTLDPLASGVLPVCIGKATKIVDYIMKDYKIYESELKLGIVTDTYDQEGKIISINEDTNFSKEEILNCINSFKGDIAQIPPMYSAIKIKGKKLYELARKGIEVEREPRPITIYDINIWEINNPYIKFQVKCSKGTYIRSLCYDIGEKLNCGATMWSLERTQSGIFNKDNAVKLEDLNETNIQNYIISMDEALSNYEKISVNSKAEKLLINGVKVADKKLLNGIDLNKMYRVYSDKDEFLGLGIRSTNGLKIKKLLL